MPMHFMFSAVALFFSSENICGIKTFFGLQKWERDYYYTESPTVMVIEAKRIFIYKRSVCLISDVEKAK